MQDQTFGAKVKNQTFGAKVKTYKAGPSKPAPKVVKDSPKVKTYKAGPSKPAPKVVSSKQRKKASGSSSDSIQSGVISVNPGPSGGTLSR